MNQFKNVSWNASNICRLIIPIILGFCINFIPQCRVKDAGAVVKFRPPKITFSIVWSILYILFGLSWILAYKEVNVKNGKILVDVFYSIITILLSLWIIIYGCLNNKKGGIYVLFTCIGFVILAMNVSPITSRLMLTPLLTWIILASLLNTFEVQYTK